MSQYAPYEGTKFNYSVSEEQNLTTTDDSESGYFPEVVLESTEDSNLSHYLNKKYKKKYLDNYNGRMLSSKQKSHGPHRVLTWDNTMKINFLSITENWVL